MKPTTIDQVAITSAVTAERPALCDLLETLAEDDWQTQSLCDAWTVHDVVAHLTLATRDTTWDLVKGAIKARGSFDRMTTDTARAHARRFAPPALIEQLRASADSPRRTPFSSPLDPLVDILVHGQDIARPLALDYPISPEHALLALPLAVESRWYGGSKRFREVTLIASDADWSAGSGSDEARGTVGDLLMMATGRRAGLERLSGVGVDTLSAQMH